MLEGITVLDLASVGPAARASRWLADYGAKVIKIGPVPSRDGVQIVPPYHSYSAHRGLKRVLLDLKDPDGVGVFLQLAEHSDVVIESFRPGVVDRLGIGYAAVAARNPRIVYCSTSGYGQTGPRAQWAGHDLNYLAVSGFLDCTGRQADGRPPIPGATVADSAGGGMHAAMAILAALASGTGAHLDVSVADGMLALMALGIDEYLAEGTVVGPGRGLLTGRYACYGVYGTADDRWVSVAAIEHRFWANLCRALELDQWIDRQMDDDAQDQIRADLERRFRTRTRDEWTELLGPADTCVAPVLAVAEVVEDPQFNARGAFREVSVAGHDRFRQIAWVLAGSGGDAVVRDAQATDTEAVLAELGLTTDAVERLRVAGAVA
jgi:alpha-methylacyl-CoA racemase